MNQHLSSAIKAVAARGHVGKAAFLIGMAQMPRIVAAIMLAVTAYYKL